MDDKTSFWEPCWACRVMAGEPVGCVVIETEQVLVLINPFALTPGHALVVPRSHVENLYELPDELAAPILSTAARVARAVKREFAADGVTLRQNNEASSDQHLFHFHLHVIPRFSGDTEQFGASPQLAGRAEQEAWASRLRLAIEAVRS
ncbi:MAG: HIT family protein [Acidobacteria bacterium]|nr:HIT family protein [Acidobacteriota bacterium]